MRRSASMSQCWAMPSKTFLSSGFAANFASLRHSSARCRYSDTMRIRLALGLPDIESRMDSGQYPTRSSTARSSPNVLRSKGNAQTFSAGARRFAPPWSVEVTPYCFIVRDANGQQLAYIYFESEPGRQSAAKLLSKDEARRPTSPSCPICSASQRINKESRQLGGPSRLRAPCQPIRHLPTQNGGRAVAFLAALNISQTTASRR